MKITFGELKVGDKFSKFEVYADIPHYEKQEEFCSESRGGNLNTLDLYSGELLFMHPSRDVYVPDEEGVS
jgi:hypothetical protein